MRTREWHSVASEPSNQGQVMEEPSLDSDTRAARAKHSAESCVIDLTRTSYKFNVGETASSNRCPHPAAGGRRRRSSLTQICISSLPDIALLTYER